MTIDLDSAGNRTPGLSRRTMVKAAAWTVPVVAVAVAAPLATASVGTSTLTYSVPAFAAEDAPYGSTAVLVTNGSAQAYSGPLTFRTPAWGSASLFIDGVTAAAEGSSFVWTIPNASIPANGTVAFPVTWARPYPTTAEQQTLTVTADPTRATTVAGGDVTLHSAYQLLWAAVTPGGQGNPSGTSSFFIGNTTETDLTSAATVARTGTWSFPLPVVVPVMVNGVRFNGARAAENGTFVGRYENVPTPVAAGGDKLHFSYIWSGTNTTQQARQLISIIPDSGVVLPILGSGTIYSYYRA